MLKFEGQPEVDTLGSMRETTDYLQKAVDDFFQLQREEAELAKSGELEKDIGVAVTYTTLVKSLNGVGERVHLASEQSARLKQDDMLKLLEDPLSSETRTTRRNVGGLCALCVLLGAGGHVPKTMLGVSLEGFPGWVIPSLLGAVIAYEFVAFRMYVEADVARRRIAESNARIYRQFLEMYLKSFKELVPIIKKMFEKADTNLLDETERQLDNNVEFLTHFWGNQIEEFGVEFKLQKRRRRWDKHVPTVLLVVGLVALLSMLRGWPRLVVWLAS